jgi:GntR family transcriptional regulator
MNLNRVDKSHSISLYYQLKLIIQKKIENKEWKPFDRIPSEKVLCDYNKISPMTVRQAINALCDEGFLYKVRGKGTFVAKRQLERDLSELSSLTEMLKDEGYSVKRKVLDLATIPATKNIADKIGIKKGDDVLKIKRLMLLEKDPFYYETGYLALGLCQNVSREQFSQHSIYTIIENICGLNIDYAHLNMEIHPCKDEHCAILKVKEGTPLLYLDQIIYLVGGRPVHFVEAVTKGEKYRYTIFRKRRRAVAP